MSNITLGHEKEGGAKKKKRRCNQLRPDAWDPGMHLKDGESKEKAWMRIPKDRDEQVALLMQHGTADEIRKKLGGADDDGGKVTLASGLEKQGPPKAAQKRGRKAGPDHLSTTPAATPTEVPSHFHSSGASLLRLVLAADFAGNMDQQAEPGGGAGVASTFGSGCTVIIIARGHTRITAGRASTAALRAAALRPPEATVVLSAECSKDAEVVLEQLLREGRGAGQGQDGEDGMGVQDKEDEGGGGGLRSYGCMTQGMWISTTGQSRQSRPPT